MGYSVVEGYHFKSRANNKDFTNYKELNYQTILN